MGGIALSGYRLGYTPRALRQSAAGRICAEPECTTRLSVYNAQDRCAVHQRPSRPPRNRGRRVATNDMAPGGALR